MAHWRMARAGAAGLAAGSYDWAWVTIDAGKPGSCWLLIRRNRTTAELAWYRCWSPRHVPLAAYVAVAGRRWTTEENFQAAKGLAGLDEHRVRTWTAWHRWVTLAMIALAFLTLTAAAERQQPTPDRLIPLTRNEIAHLTAVLITRPGRDADHHQRWSLWRRRHQHNAMTSHYCKQATDDP
jgi:hypothetical protein